MIVIRIFLLTMFLFITPVLIGAPWTAILPKKNRYRLCACFPIGVFVELAVFQLLEVPFAFLHLPFTLLCCIFGTVIVIGSIYSVFLFFRQRLFRIRLPRLNGWEMLYLIVFLGLLSWQMYNGFVRDTTIWSYDDAAYVTFAADTIRYNAIQTIDPYTGIAVTFNAARALQAWLYYPAFLSLISSVPVTVIERTVLETYDILLAYVTYTYMASILFPKKDNGLIFLIFLSLLHIYGWYSQYSVTFRLLGPNYQGKAVLATSFFPLLFSALMQMLRRKYSRLNGVLLMLFSAAASSLTLFGAVTMVLNSLIVIGLSALSRKSRRAHSKHIRYIPWACSLPAVYCGIYFLYKYGQF